MARLLKENGLHRFWLDAEKDRILFYSKITEELYIYEISEIKDVVKSLLEEEEYKDERLMDKWRKLTEAKDEKET